MKVALIPNLSKKDAQFHTEMIIRTLCQYGAEVLLYRPMEPYFGSLPVTVY